MPGAKGKPTAAACVAALVLAVPSTTTSVRAAADATQQAPSASPASKGPSERWNTVSAIVSIRRGVQDDGTPGTARPAPAAVYRWESRQAGDTWTSSMAVLAGPRPPVITPAGKQQEIMPLIARVEDSGDGSGPRFYTRDGKEVRLPGDAERQKLRSLARSSADTLLAGIDDLVRPSTPLRAGGPGLKARGHDWIDAIVPSRERKDSRRAALRRRLGATHGKVRGFERYLQAVDDKTTEVLVDAEWSVPVEINVMSGAVLESHTTYSYVPGPGGALVRSRTHSEHLLPDSHGKRLAIDVELTNVMLEERR
jgi:hypothetical protein